MRPPAVPAHLALAALSFAASMLAACAGGGTPAPTPGATLPPTPAPSTGASQEATASAAAVPGGSRPPASGGPTSSVTITPEPGPSGAFACGYPYERAATRTDPVALVHDVRVGAHDTYDRVVFEFLGTGVPSVRLERVTPPFVKDPSGLPLAVAGGSFLKVTLLGASGVGYATSDGQPTYTGATTFSSGFTRLVSLVRAGDFEGITTWYAGLTAAMCSSIFELGNPARLVIDLRAS